MDYIMIGPYQFDRDASKDDMRLDYCSSFQEVALDESSLSFDTVSVEVCTKTICLWLLPTPETVTASVGAAMAHGGSCCSSFSLRSVAGVTALVSVAAATA